MGKRTWNSHECPYQDLTERLLLKARQYLAEQSLEELSHDFNRLLAVSINSSSKEENYLLFLYISIVKNRFNEYPRTNKDLSFED